MKLEISTCILDRLFPFCSVIVNTSDKTEALKLFIEHLKWELDKVDVEAIAKQSDDCIYEPLEWSKK